MLDQLATVNVCIYKTFYEYFFSAQDSNSFSSYKKCILNVTLQDVTLQLTGLYQSLTLKSTAF